MKVIFSGLESSGKSYKLAVVAAGLVERNAKWKQRSGIVRPIVSNLQFTKKFYDWATIEKGVPIVYWTNLDELIKYEQADILVDEVGNYFDSRMWTDLSLDARRWLTQGAKSGIELYGTAQDFAQVDKAFRRLVNNLIHITKIVGSRRPAATKPPVKRIWGICMSRELDPVSYDEDKKKFADSGLRSFFFLERKYCELFDTTQKIVRSAPSPFRHVARKCELHGAGCLFEKVTHA